jgi:hypothetical protein
MLRGLACGLTRERLVRLKNPSAKLTLSQRVATAAGLRATVLVDIERPTVRFEQEGAIEADDCS